jgi:thymidylate synthase
MADEFVYFLGNAHIYEEHIEALNEQIKKTPYPFPTINIINKYNTIEEYGVTDIQFINEYQSHDAVKMEMKA